MHTGRQNQARGSTRRAMAPFAVFAFLLAQLLVGFHHHADDPLNRTAGDLPTAECTLCLAAHLPFDIAPAPAFTAPADTEAANEAAVSGHFAPAATRALHQPRAPPAYSPHIA